MERDDVKKIAQLRTLAQASQWTENKKSRYLRYLEYLDANDKAQRTQCIYAANIKGLGDFLVQKEFEDYSEDDMVAYKTSLKEHGYAPYSIHNHMLDCQTFIKWCLRLENGEKPACINCFGGKIIIGEFDETKFEDKDFEIVD